MRRIIHLTDSGPVLVEMPDGAKGSVVVVGETEAVELDVTNAQWKQLHKQLKTRKLDFATVKSDHGIIKESK